MTNDITQDINKYCINHSNPESKLLQSIREYTLMNEEMSAMISGPIVANFLQNLIHMIHAKSVLEIGMFTGYSAMAMAEALPDNGIVHTCELMSPHVKTAQNFFNQYNKNKFYIHEGDAKGTLETFSVNSFDLIFIDADKINYIHYYKKAMMLIKNGGIIVLDNMLWGGTVLDPQTEESKTLNELNQLISNDNRNKNVLLPIRDGLMMCMCHG